MTVYGYWRCSTNQQDQERQILSLKEEGCEVIKGDKITGVSDYGDRPELSKLLEEVEEGSVIILSELSRLGRTMVTMLVEVNKLLDKGVDIKTLDGRLDTTKMPKEIVRLIVSIMGYSAEQELQQIKSRTSEGREIAKSRGVTFGRRRTYDKYQVQEILKKRTEGESYGQIAKSMGMNRGTVQKIINREKVSV